MMAYRTVLTLLLHSDAKHVEFEGPKVSLAIDRKEWHQLHDPSTITVTIEPGNTVR